MERCGRLGHCIYEEEEEQTSAINGMIDDALYNFATLANSAESSFLYVNEIFPKVLMKFGIFFKDHSFHEEKEWRLVTYITNYHDERLCFRPGKSMLIPYYKISLEQESWQGEIAAVTIGPCPHPDIAKLAVDGLLLKYGLTDGENSVVTPSRIPYRYW